MPPKACPRSMVGGGLDRGHGPVGRTRLSGRNCWAPSSRQPTTAGGLTCPSSRLLQLVQWPWGQLGPSAKKQCGMRPASADGGGMTFLGTRLVWPAQSTGLAKTARQVSGSHRRHGCPDTPFPRQLVGRHGRQTSHGGRLVARAASSSWLTIVQTPVDRPTAFTYHSIPQEPHVTYGTPQRPAATVGSVVWGRQAVATYGHVTVAGWHSGRMAQQHPATTVGRAHRAPPAASLG